MLRSKKFWKCAFVRAIKTVCQSACGVIGASVYMGDVDWINVASISLLSGILSILTSLGGIPEASEKVMEIEDNEDKEDNEDDN